MFGKTLCLLVYLSRFSAPFPPFFYFLDSIFKIQIKKTYIFHTNPPEFNFFYIIFSSPFFCYYFFNNISTIPPYPAPTLYFCQVQYTQSWLNLQENRSFTYKVILLLDFSLERIKRLVPKAKHECRPFIFIDNVHKMQHFVRFLHATKFNMKCKTFLWTLKSETSTNLLNTIKYSVFITSWEIFWKSLFFSRSF